MTDKEFKKLNRAQLVDIIYQLQLNQEKLTAENQAMRDEVADKRVRLGQAGNIAEAALAVNHVMQAAQNAADLYLAEIRGLLDEAEEERRQAVEKTQKEADTILARARVEVDAIVAQAKEEAASLVAQAHEEAAAIAAQAKEEADAYLAQVRLEAEAIISQAQLEAEAIAAQAEFEKDFMDAMEEEDFIEEDEEPSYDSAVEAIMKEYAQED